MRKLFSDKIHFTMVNIDYPENHDVLIRNSIKVVPVIITQKDDIKEKYIGIVDETKFIDIISELLD